jgi:hypothetical protein
MKIALSAALTAAALTLSGAAHAASCKGVVAIDSVYQQGSNGSFEYFVQVRNETQKPVHVDVEARQFPANVKIFSPSMPGVALDTTSKRVEKLRFANGSNDQIHNGTVSRAYDSRPSGPGAYVLVTNCR